MPTWTDWNSHDPGVTLLEVLVYTVSDLATDFRTRPRRDRCGWRCAMIIAAAAAGAVLVIGRVMSERNSEDESSQH